MIGDLHQLFKAGLRDEETYPKLKKYFYKEHLIVSWEVFLTTKFSMWVEPHSDTANTLHGSGRVVQKSSILLQIKKAAESSDGDLTCHVFTFEYATRHLTTRNLNEILIIEE